MVVYVKRTTSITLYDAIWENPSGVAECQIEFMVNWV